MNEVRTLLASAARTADATAEVQTSRHKGAVVVIDVTAISATPSVVFTIRGSDPVSGQTWDILASAAVTAVGTTVLKVYPALASVANDSENDVLPPVWEVFADHADADSITYSVTAHLIA